MKTIPLSQGKVALVDDEDYERISKFKWYLMTTKHAQYARCHDPKDSDHILLMHRMVVGARGKQEVDH